jgi:hypothetical protein
VEQGEPCLKPGSMWDIERHMQTQSVQSRVVEIKSFGVVNSFYQLPKAAKTNALHSNH